MSVSTLRFNANSVAVCVFGSTITLLSPTSLPLVSSSLVESVGITLLSPTSLPLVSSSLVESGLACVNNASTSGMSTWANALVGTDDVASIIPDNNIAAIRNTDLFDRVFLFILGSGLLTTAYNNIADLLCNMY